MDVIREYWGFIMSAVAGVLWLGRLESRANQNTIEIQRLETRLEKQRVEDLSNNKLHRDEVKATLGEIKQDIKELLRGKRNE
jgi:hypothetical protein